MLYTGPAEEPAEDLADKIDIVARRPGRRQLADRPLDDARRKAAASSTSRPTAPQNSWLARARSNLQVMYRTALAVSHTLDIDQLLNRIMELIFEWVEADRGCIMLIDPSRPRRCSPRSAATRKGIDAGRARSPSARRSSTT